MGTLPDPLAFPPFSLSPCRGGGSRAPSVTLPGRSGGRVPSRGAAGVSGELPQPLPPRHQPCDRGSLLGPAVPGRSLAALPGGGGHNRAAAPPPPYLKLELHLGQQHLQEFPGLFSARSCAPFVSSLARREGWDGNVWDFYGTRLRGVNPCPAEIPPRCGGSSTAQGQPPPRRRAGLPSGPGVVRKSGSQLLW